jgi:L-seryl-tRNA(Ser) seleniumtransferase
VVVSGDKLFGGPQAGIVVGGSALIARLRSNPLCRALRVDKVTLAGLEATARLHLDPARAVREIPTLRMLAETAESVRARAQGVAGALVALGVGAEVVSSAATVGGGTYPDVVLPSWAVAPASGSGATALAARLRAGSTPVVGRIEEDRLLLDLRTVAREEADVLVRAVAEAVGPVP